MSLLRVAAYGNGVKKTLSKNHLGFLSLLFKCLQIGSYFLLTDSFNFRNLLLDCHKLVAPARKIPCSFLQIQKFFFEPVSNIITILLLVCLDEGRVFPEWPTTGI